MRRSLSMRRSSNETGVNDAVHAGAKTIREEHPSRNDVSLIGGQMVILRQQMRSKPERTDDVLAALAAIVPGARATQGVISLDIARDLLEPDSFVATGV